MRKLVKRYASITEAKCSLLLITDNDVFEFIGCYNDKVAELIEDIESGYYNDYDDEDLVDIIETTLMTYNKVVETKIKKTQEELEQYQREYPDNLISLVYNDANYLTEDNWLISDDEDPVLYIKGTDVGMPQLLLEHIYDSDNDVDKLAYFNFWKRLCANPLVDVKKRLFDWIIAHGIKITDSGLLIGYRGAVPVSETETIPISELFWRCRNERKKPSEYGVIRTFNDDEEEYGIVPLTKISSLSVNDASFVSYKSLHTLIDEIPEITYTHSYTRNDGKKIYFKLNEVYRDDLEIDINGNKDCSIGLHFGNLKFGISSFGDAILGVLVCPSNIGAVPKSDTNKARASELYPFVEFTSIENMEEFHRNGSVLMAESNYCANIQERLQKRLDIAQSLKIKLDYDGQNPEVKTKITELQKELEKLSKSSPGESLDEIRKRIWNIIVE